MNIMLIKQICDELKPYDVFNKKTNKQLQKKRYGSYTDGGYVMIDGFNYDAFYSYGISNDISFELDFLHNTSLICHAYDHTIDILPYNESIIIGSSKKYTYFSKIISRYNLQHIDLNIKFADKKYEKLIDNDIKILDKHEFIIIISQKNKDKIGWNHKMEIIISMKNNVNLIWKKEGIDMIDSTMLKKLETHIITNNDMNKQNILLKMDVEGCEWNVFNDIDENILCKFKQILIEVHMVSKNITTLNGLLRELIQYNVLTALKKINKYFRLVHVHHNNSSEIAKIEKINCKLPIVLELSYIRNDNEFEFKDSKTSYPMENLDTPNNNNNPVYKLDFYPFRL